MKLSGKIAVVTGSGRGIGRAVALKLAEEGARVVVNDLDGVQAEEVVEAIRDRGGEAISCIGNVTSTQFGAEIIAAVQAKFGGLDIIVNNAGYTWDSVIQKTTDEQWYAMLDCHITAPFRILRAAQPVIRELVEKDRAAGRRVVRKVVNVSSIVGIYGNAGQIAYASAKAAVIGLTGTLAKEWGRYDVTVNCVAFGFIETRLAVATTDPCATAVVDGQQIKIGINPAVFDRVRQAIPLGRLGTPEEAAGSVFLFCIPESDYVSGQTFICGGGLSGL